VGGVIIRWALGSETGRRTDHVTLRTLSPTAVRLCIPFSSFSFPFRANVLVRRKHINTRAPAPSRASERWPSAPFSPLSLACFYFLLPSRPAATNPSYRAVARSRFLRRKLHDHSSSGNHRRCLLARACCETSVCVWFALVASARADRLDRLSRPP